MRRNWSGGAMRKSLFIKHLLHTNGGFIVVQSIMSPFPPLVSSLSISFLSYPRDWPKNLIHTKQALYQMQNLRLFFFFKSFWDRVLLSHSDEVWIHAEAQAGVQLVTVLLLPLKKLGIQVCPTRPGSWCFLYYGLFDFLRTKAHEAQVTEQGWPGTQRLFYGILENPINRETVLQAAEPAQKVASAEGHLASLCCPRDRFFVKMKCERCRKTIMEYYTGSPLLCEKSIKTAAKGSPLAALRKSVSPFSGDSVLMAPKDACPSSSVPYTRCSQDHPGRLCPPWSTRRLSSMAFFNTPVPINVYCLMISMTVFRSQGTGTNGSSRDSTVIWWTWYF